MPLSTTNLHCQPVHALMFVGQRFTDVKEDAPRAMVYLEISCVFAPGQRVIQSSVQPFIQVIGTNARDQLTSRSIFGD